MRVQPLIDGIAIIERSVRNDGEAAGVATDIWRKPHGLGDHDSSHRRAANHIGPTEIVYVSKPALESYISRLTEVCLSEVK
jgi:hypothetical protein